MWRISRRSAFLAACLLIGGLAACGRETPDAANEPSAAAARVEPSVKLPETIATPAPALDRAALLAAVAQAASAHSAGVDDHKAQSELVGRRFLIKLRFGCDGPSERGALAWTYDENEQRLMVRAKPDIDAANAKFEALPDGSVEAVEGFWVPRPWLLSDACPAERAGLDPVAPPTVGIANYFTADDSRVQRRANRSYEIVTRTDPAIRPSSKGFNLVIEGRLKPWPGANVIQCHGAGREARPHCIVSAEFDRVAFENPETDLTIAQWSDG